VISEYITISLPFVFAIFLLFASRYSKKLILQVFESELRVRGDFVSIGDQIKELSIAVSMRTLTQSAFVIGMLVALVSFVSTSHNAEVNWLIALVVVLGLCLIAFWITYWSHLSAKQLSQSSGKTMFIWSLLFILLQWAISLSLYLQNHSRDCQQHGQVTSRLVRDQPFSSKECMFTNHT